jgi:hypothetical protein
VLDQLPESLLPLWGMQTVLGSSWTEMVLSVIIFAIIDLLLSTLLRSARA